VPGALFAFFEINFFQPIVIGAHNIGNKVWLRSWQRPWLKYGGMRGVGRGGTRRKRYPSFVAYLAGKFIFMKEIENKTSYNSESRRIIMFFIMLIIKFEVI
jgi:hypothetical protein